MVDPSFFNRPALSDRLVGHIVPDFPLCNKSFNQSYFRKRSLTWQLRAVKMGEGL